MKTKYSYSRLNMFDQCALKYQYRYIDKIKIEFESIEAFMGKRVHEALEELYKNADSQITEDALLEMYSDRWEAEYTSDVQVIKKDKEVRDYYEIGKLCLMNYFRRYHPFDQAETLALESYMEASLDSANQFRLMGFIDRLSKNEEGMYEIHDYKTSSALPTQAEIDEDNQLALYQLGIQQKHADAKTVKLIWHYLVHDKELVSERSLDQLEALKQNTIDRINKVESATNFPYTESPLCAWCEYQEICPAKTNRKMTVTKPERAKELVNQLSDLAKERQRLTKRLEAIQAEIAQIMSLLKEKNKDISKNLFSGSEYDLELVDRTWFKYDTSKNDFNEFLSVIRDLKKEEELLKMASTEIDRAIHDNDWKASEIEALKPFLQTEETKTFILKKKK